jgi:hypothetical protein
LIHPIAGKCKHCKADLTAIQAARPAAATPLPSLRGPSGATPGGPTPGPAAQAHVNGQVHWYPKGTRPASPAAEAFASPAPRGPAPAAQILPPRPTSRGHAVELDRGGWRSWPVIVIALAMVAIVVAVVLMVWPAGDHRDGAGKRGGPPPAPDRMETAPNVTAPTVPSPGVQPAQPAQQQRDPWADPPPANQPHASIAPVIPPAPPSVAPDPLADDLSSVPPPPPAPPAHGRHRLGLNNGASVMILMVGHICRRAAQCGALPDDDAQLCTSLPKAVPPVSCDAARRCFRHIDQLPCDDDLDPRHAGTFLGTVTDCADAANC